VASVGKGGALMVVKGWSDGSPNNTTGSGYGVCVRREDREKKLAIRGGVKWISNAFGSFPFVWC